IGMISTEIKELYVTATNEPPILTAPPDIIYMTEDTEYGPISMPGWFFDPDSDPLTFTVSPNPRITHRFAGTNLYLTPDPTNWTGITTIVITATDPFNASVSKLVTITVSNQNDPPSFTPRTWSLVTGSTLAVNFADYITDPDTPSSQISIQVFNTEVIPHVFLSYSPNVPGVLNGTFYASTGFSGTETFNIIINDHVSRSITLSNFDVQVLSTLTADPQINITTGYTGQAISFSDQTTGNPNQWLWNFGNGVTSTQQNPTYSYTSPGIYNVQLTVTNTQAGITSNASPPVQVNMVGILPASCDITTTQSWAQALGQDQYNVFHNLNISPGSTLSIASGIKVNIFDSTSVNIAGAVSANNVIFRPQAGLTKWQGLKFLTSGQSSSLSNSTIYNAVNPILISSDNVQLNNVSICLTDTSMVMPGSGVTITGSNSPTLNEVGISNYKTGITVIGAPLRRASTPTLTNIRVRNSTDSSREEEPTIGIEILGEVSAQIENVEVINYDIGILFDNSSSQNYSAPTLDNVLIQNEPQSRQGITGLEIIGSVRAEIDELEIERFETGIIYQDYASTGTPTPTLTNIRVRNSTDSSRSESVGLFLDNAVKIQISNTDIDSFDTGIRIKSSNSGAQSTPTLTNIRVRNSTDSSRGNIAGIDLIGYVSPQFSNILVDKYNLGIIWSGTEEALNTTPTLTNIRVRNSTDSSRPESRGVVIKDVLEFTASNDTIEFYSLGLEITKTSGTNNSTPTLTNIRVRNSTDSSRLDHTGVFLGEYVAGTMSECMIENYKTGIFMANGNQTVLTYNYIKNCGIGIKASGYEKEPPPLTRNIIKVESSWVAAHPNWTYTAFDLANEGPWDIRNSIILGYSTCLTAADADINFRNNIVYATFDITAPFNLTNSDLSYTYNDINTSGSFPQGSHNFNSNPLFDTENIHHLTYNSPCIDAGDPECDEDEDGTVIDVGVYPYLHKADFTPKSSVITYGDIINFSNQTIGHDHPSTSYIWDLNNDSSPDGVTKNWSHQFNDVGYFSLKLTVTTGNLADSILVENAIFVNDNKLKTVESMQVGLDGDDVVLTWEPIVETLRGLAIEVDYYLIYTASDPYGTFDLLDCIIDGDTTFIHTNGSTEGSGFYLVIGLAGTQQEFEDFRDSHPTYPFNRNLLPFKQRR
ncbi:MAG: PKD domain-containing protein, partial [Candidatus Cloacimonetes bacterium]|nr:PKD domain-containing protein [Candidatus Cloacimonadota bacterium]